MEELKTIIQRRGGSKALIRSSNRALTRDTAMAGGAPSVEHDRYCVVVLTMRSLAVSELWTGERALRQALRQTLRQTLRGDDFVAVLLLLRLQANRTCGLE